MYIHVLELSLESYWAILIQVTIYRFLGGSGTLKRIFSLLNWLSEMYIISAKKKL